MNLEGETDDHRQDETDDSLAQVTWIGYPNTTGLDCVHYRITDGICDPIDRFGMERDSGRQKKDEQRPRCGEVDKSSQHALLIPLH